jgi:hypothetical protein
MSVRCNQLRGEITTRENSLDSAASELRFGSFSLGDVFEREISKFGRFAFRGKHSKGESSKRFVEEFVKLHERCRTELDEEERKEGEQEKEGKNEGEIGKKHKQLLGPPRLPNWAQISLWDLYVAPSFALLV